MDYGHAETDKMLKKLERKINKEFSAASVEIEKKTKAYLKQLEADDAIMLKKLENNEIDKKQYLTWRSSQVTVGKRFEALKATLDEDIGNANKIASELVKGHTYDVYALNHNYGTYEAEKGSLVNTSYTLYSRDTVTRLVKENPMMLPVPGKKVAEKIKRGELRRWNNKHIQSVMLQGVLQGQTIEEMADNLATTLGESNSYSMIRAARTMTTGAENAGRIDSYLRAADMGIKLNKQWLSAHDSKVRMSHRELDGVSVPLNEDFPNGCAYPGDPMGLPEEVYNCRCTLVADVDAGSNEQVELDPELEDIDFEEWCEERL